MALLKNDELNNLESFFEPMELSDEDKKKRVDLAYEIYAMLTRFFTIVKASLATGTDIDRNYLVDYFTRYYKDLIVEQGYNKNLDDDYYDFYIDMIADSIVDTSLKGGANALSDTRVIEIAQNDANVIENHNKHMQMKLDGFKTKRWVTMADEKVRFNHVMADGEEVPIDQPFKVGGSELMYPTDISLGADASEVINCRCGCIYYR